MTLFEIVAASPEVCSLIGSGPVRFFPFGDAPQGVASPYATYQLVGGSPFNTLTTPKSDRHSYQIDVFAKGQSACISVVNAILDVIQSEAYISGYNISARDQNTGLWRVSFDVDVINDR